MKRATLNKAITLALSVMAFAGCASTGGLKTEVPTAATTWTETFRVECHLGKSQEREVTCTHEGEQVRLRYGCGEKVAEYVYSCQTHPGAPAPQPPPEAATMTDATVAEDTTTTVGPILGKWGVGVGGVYLNAAKDGGPSVGGMDFTFVGDLRMAGNWLFFHFEAGPGFLKGDDIESFSTTEFVGARAEVKSWFAVTAGGRHRIAFNGDTDNINAIFGELQLGFSPLKWLELSVSGALGHTWFPEETRVTTPRPDGNLDYLDLQSAGKGLGFSVGGGATVRF